MANKPITGIYCTQDLRLQLCIQLTPEEALQLAERLETLAGEAEENVRRRVAECVKFIASGLFGENSETGREFTTRMISEREILGHAAHASIRLDTLLWFGRIHSEEEAARRGVSGLGGPAWLHQSTGAPLMPSAIFQTAEEAISQNAPVFTLE